MKRGENFDVSSSKLHVSRHTPVLLHEVITLLNPQPGDFVIDGTIDGGGHAAEIVKRIMPNGKLLGIDWDERMLGGLKIKREYPENVLLAHANYAEIPDILEQHHLPRADGLLLDLGFSSEQLATSGRGFSFLKDEPLMMTYDASAIPASRLLRRMSEHELAKIIYEFGGEKFSRRIARAIKAQEKRKPIETTRELAEIIAHTVPGNYEMRRINPATRTFQALRIYANNELGNLEKILQAMPEVCAPGGRVAIVSFHSLEDGLVKKYFKQFEKEKKMKLITKKPITPRAAEEVSNPRSRSAKLRGAYAC